VRFQFHPNLSYEDFVRGHRPEAGKLELVDGPFLEVVKAAQGDLDNTYVVVIEEINRGNPAQIFGEMLTLLESDKRNEDEALALAMPRAEDERIHIPPNVYVIGTMNVADRSLALVDLALRRRFTFVDLEPMFGDPWRSWMHEQGGVDDNHLRKIEQRMTVLNEVIAADQSLGKQFRVGHSYVTTPPGVGIDDPVTWFREVVETEIAPLLREYWFD
jgi:5-methylcytosine-specific restriction protein B